MMEARQCVCGHHSFAPLTRGYVVIADPDAGEWLWGRRWFAKTDYSTVYAECWERLKDNRRRHMSMHRFVTGASGGRRVVVDHINGNGLDNRRENLRICTNQQNQGNAKARRGSSQFKGVSRKGNRWIAYIQFNRKFRSLGSFESEHDAALAYDAAALECFGEFAALNFPEAKP